MLLLTFPLNNIMIPRVLFIPGHNKQELFVQTQSQPREGHDLALQAEGAAGQGARPTEKRSGLLALQLAL